VKVNAFVIFGGMYSTPVQYIFNTGIAGILLDPLTLVVPFRRIIGLRWAVAPKK
jgi:hypothetical protein